MQGITPYGTRPDPGLPLPPYWAAHLGGETETAEAAPVGGGPQVRAAAAGYWTRRGLWTDTDHAVAGPGGEPLLLGLLAAIGGDIVLPRPAASWFEPLTRLLGRSVFRVPAPAEGGGAPDPFALLETVRRARAAGGDPRVLVLSAVDDPSGTVTPPEAVHETCEAAADADLLVVSDETYSDTVHHHDTVVLSPAEMLPERTIVLTDLGASLTPPGWPVALARFPATDEGLALRERTLLTCAELRAVLPGPAAAATAYALSEPDEVREWAAAATRLHSVVATAAHRAVTAAGALCRPPQAGFQLYAELAGHPVEDAAALEQRLTERLGRPVLGGHHFGDEAAALRVRVDTGPLHGRTEQQRRAALDATDPLAVPHVAAALTELRAAFTELSAG